MPLFPPLNLPYPAIISNEDQGGSAVVLLTAAAVYVYAFELNVTTTIVSVRWRCGTTGAGNTNIGIYTLAGNLVAGSDTGAQANAASTIKTFTYGTAVVLPPGQYLMALSASASTDDYQGVTGSGNSLPFSRARLATNSVSGGALPSTLGALSSSTVMPMFALLTSGGLG